MKGKNQHDRSRDWKETLQIWQEHRQKIVELSESGLSNIRIAEMMDLSRERVRQILNKEAGK